MGCATGWCPRRSARHLAITCRAWAIKWSGRATRWSTRFAWRKWSISRSGCRRAWRDEHQHEHRAPDRTGRRHPHPDRAAAAELHRRDLPHHHRTAGSVRAAEALSTPRYAAAYHRLPPNARGALWMLASAISFTVMTMLIKFLGDDYPSPLQTFYRQLAGLLVVLPVVLPNPRRVLYTTRPGIMLFRAAAGTLAMVLAFYAYQKMPLADANALSFTRTLWLVPLAAFVLKEAVGPRRVAATVMGFVGALLMLQPQAQLDMGWPATAALASGLLFALTVTGMKVLTRDHSTMTLMAWYAILGFVLAIPTALYVWRWPSAPDLALLATMGVLGVITQACYINGMSEGDAAAMAPIDYTRLVFAVILGYALFGDIPNTMTMLGAGIVMGSTIYITLREARLGTSKPPPDRVD